MPSRRRVRPADQLERGFGALALRPERLNALLVGELSTILLNLRWFLIKAGHGATRAMSVTRFDAVPPGVDELVALAKAAGVDHAALATMSGAEKIAAISGQRESVLRAGAKSAGIVGAETMPAAQLAAAMKAQAGGARPVGGEGAAERVAAQEAVFDAILGDTPKSIAKASDEELAEHETGRKGVKLRSRKRVKQKTSKTEL